MPYSVDGDENKRNAASPSFISLQDQFIYRIASLEATIKGSFARLDEKITEMQKDSVEDRLKVAEVAAKLEGKVESHKAALDTRIGIVEKWQNRITWQVTGVMGALMVFWTVFGDIVRKFLGTNA